MKTTRKLLLVITLTVIGIALVVDYLEMEPLLQRFPHVLHDEDASTSTSLQNSSVTDCDTASESKMIDSLFQKASRTAYQTAVTPPANLARKKFDLSSWSQRTMGGLVNGDRNLLGELYYNATSVFEFGLGESTFIAAATGVPRYAGVDSDPNWVSQAREKSKMQHFRFYLADIGKTGLWGYPSDPKLNKNVFQYQLAALSAEDEPFDVYFVDCRYRVACSLVSFMHAASLGADMSKIRVVTHDNDDKSRGYHQALRKVGVVVAKSDKLLVYRQRNDTSQEDLYNLWKQYRNDIR